MPVRSSAAVGCQSSNPGLDATAHLISNVLKLVFVLIIVFIFTTLVGEMVAGWAGNVAWAAVGSGKITRSPSILTRYPQ